MSLYVFWWRTEQCVFLCADSCILIQNMVPRKKAEQQKKVFFPESIDYVTTQGDYGKEFHDYRNERRSRSARPLKEASLDIYHTSTSSIGNQYKECVPRYASNRTRLQR